MRSEEEIRTVLAGFLKTATNSTSTRECEKYGVATGCLLWVLGVDPEDVVGGSFTR